MPSQPTVNSLARQLLKDLGHAFWNKGAYSDEAGRGFRFEAGRRSEAKPATIPI
jgi:hypothetical protein